MGRLELPVPDLGSSLRTAAKDLEARIRAAVPPSLRDTVVVTTFKKGDRSGLAIEYDDRAENLVYAAIEYPRGGRKEETIDPGR